LSEDILVRICDALKPVFYDEHSYIVKEGDPIDAIFFITKGIAWTYATSNKGEGTVLKSLVEGQFFGGELLEWVKKSKKPTPGTTSRNSQFLQKSSKPTQKWKPLL
jgi:cyclic nucleotide gated channel